MKIAQGLPSKTHIENLQRVASPTPSTTVHDKVQVASRSDHVASAATRLFKVDLDSLKRIKIAPPPAQKLSAKLFGSTPVERTRLPLDQVTPGEHQVLKQTLQFLAQQPAAAKWLQAVDGLPYEKVLLTAADMPSGKSMIKEEYTKPLGNPEPSALMLAVNRKLFDGAQPNAVQREVYGMLIHAALSNAPVDAVPQKVSMNVMKQGRPLDLASALFIKREQDRLWHDIGLPSAEEKSYVREIKKQMVDNGTWPEGKKTLLQRVAPELHPSIKEVEIRGTSFPLDQTVGIVETLKEQKRRGYTALMRSEGDGTKLGDPVQIEEVLRQIHHAAAQGEISLNDVANALMDPAVSKVSKKGLRSEVELLLMGALGEAAHHAAAPIPGKIQGDETH